MKKVLYTNPGVFCIVHGPNESLMSYAEGLEIFEESKHLYAEWFDKLALYTRSIGIDSFEQEKTTIRVHANEQSLEFVFIDRAFYKKIIERGWLRKDLVIDLDSDEAVQKYFSALSAYS